MSYIKWDKRCKTCKAIKEEKRRFHSQKLLQRIYNSRHYTRGGESLKQIVADNPGVLSYQSLYQHVHTHQFLSEDDSVTKDLERRSAAIGREKIRKMVQHTELRQEIIDQVFQGLEDGSLKPSVTHGIAAMGQQAGIEEKQKDRASDMMKMIAMFQSGEMARPAEAEIINPTDATEEIDEPTTA